MRHLSWLIAFFACVLLVFFALPHISPPPIPLAHLFPTDQPTAWQLSPNGQYLSFIKTDQLWLAPVAHPDRAQPILSLADQDIDDYYWAYTNKHIIYSQDTSGDENWVVSSLDISTKTSTPLTPPGRQSTLLKLSPQLPDIALIVIADITAGPQKVVLANLTTGQAQTIFTNRPGFAAFWADDQLQIRLGRRQTQGGGYDLVAFTNNHPGHPLIRLSPTDAFTTNPLHISANQLYLADSRSSNTSALTSVDLDSAFTTRLASSPQSDLESVLFDPRTHHPQAVLFTHSTQSWQTLDSAVESDFDFFSRRFPHANFSITDQTQDDSLWLVTTDSPTQPPATYLYSRPHHQLSPLSPSSPVDSARLAPTTPYLLTTPDRYPLVSYLTRPQGIRPPYPAVVLVHGGPWARDSWEFDPEVQWLANRGFAVLQVNFRGSTGFGKNFLNAADRQWGRAMQDDLYFATQYFIDQKVIDPKQVILYGASYGGYAALMGLLQRPDLYSAGIAVSPVTDLIQDQQENSCYCLVDNQYYPVRIGRQLHQISPIASAAKLSRPLLLVHNPQDTRIRQSQSDHFASLVPPATPFVYASFTNEGHGVTRPENQIAFHQLLESFLFHRPPPPSPNLRILKSQP